jgi:pentapeptide MXKDX repeat protein
MPRTRGPASFFFSAWTLVWIVVAAGVTASPGSAQAGGRDAMEKDAMGKDAMSKGGMAESKGELRGADGHAAAGSFEMTGTGKERRLRFGSDFKVERGPDVYVVLTRGPKVTVGDLNLGKLKRFSGTSDYLVPAEADLGSYTHLLVWCRKYSVAMALAPLPHPAMAGEPMSSDSLGNDEMSK